jgi:zinc/manganese transport system substrate-binding protein
MPILLAGAMACTLLVGCGPADESRSSEPPVGGPCPVRPIEVVATVDQWGIIAEQLAGSCAHVTSIVSGGGVDPHDYEPTPADAAALARADVIVLNGVGYDAWAERSIDAMTTRPTVVDIGGAWDLPAGADPHLWYEPDVVTQSADRITSALIAASPEATEFFSARAADFDASMEEYGSLIDRLHARFAVAQGGAVTFLATEAVFDGMATALGMVDRTPEGFARAVSNGGEPSPGDIAAFMDALADGSVSVLIVNAQSSSSMTDRLREQAAAHHVPIVEITETVAPGASTFAEWQIVQLRALASALGMQL